MHEVYKLTKSLSTSHDRESVIKLILTYANIMPLDVEFMLIYIADKDIMHYFNILIMLPINEYTVNNIIVWVNCYINNVHAQEMLDTLLDGHCVIRLTWFKMHKSHATFIRSMLNKHELISSFKRYSKADTCIDVGTMLIMQELVNLSI